MKKYMITIYCLLLPAISLVAQLQVGADKRFLITSNGKPFFWLGDTAWELFHRLTRSAADLYLTDRAAKGFTVIQAVVLAELDGLHTPNAYGNTPLINDDPTKPNEAYFQHVDYIVNKAAKLGLVMAMLPSWGDKWNRKRGTGPEIFTAENARVFGEYLGRRYKNKPIIWVMGGDRDVEEQQDYDIIRGMAAGLKKGDGGKHLFTFHPQGGKSSSDFFKDDDWIDIHMSQTGHSSEAQNYTFNLKNRALTPVHPYLDGEPSYEDHPDRWDPAKLGWMDDAITRQKAYWSLFSGACGHTYGNHNIWQFYTEERQPISWARTHWTIALSHPGSQQVGFMRKLFEKRNWQKLVPDQSIITSDNPETPEYNMALLSQDADGMMVYLPYGKKITINTSKIKAATLRGWWFNPRDGRTVSIGIFDNKGEKEMAPHSEGRGSDWVLVIDDASKNYPDPRVLPN
jgi:hypothetical protein